METLRSFVYGTWHEADTGFASLVNPSTEEEIARASSHGVDFGRVLEWARTAGGPALRSLTFAQRADLVKQMSKALREHRDELLELSATNGGATKPDGSFDVDGASGTLAYYGAIGKRLGDRHLLFGDDGTQLARTEAFWGRHALAPLQGVAVHVNAFNFPAWGFAEKAACAILAGVPVVTKPATATALVAVRCVEIVIEAGILPEGALQLIAGGTGDLLDRLGPQDVLAFTGSADTASRLRDRPNLRDTNTRINVEADSLNAAVLGPGVSAEATLGLFMKDVVREMTQKTGQKCTAVRRILVPAADVDRIEEELVSHLGHVVPGVPGADGVTMGPVASAQQLADCELGVAELAAEAEIVHGTGRRVDGTGASAGKGYFFGPTLLRAKDPGAARVLHEREVFGPVATLVPYDGSAAEAARTVGLGGGTLVTSVYADDMDWLSRFTGECAAHTGRIYIGSSESAEAAPGSGVALPQSLHGGPGRAGGGQELGGMVGVEQYLQRVALQGARGVVDALLDEKPVE